MSDHHESNTPIWVAYIAAAVVVTFVAMLGFQLFFSGDDSQTATDQTTLAEESVSEPTQDGAVLELMLEDGPVVIQMRPDLAPLHVAQIVALTSDGFYDGIVFHRVIDGFMAQTGDPTGTGMGGSDLPDLPAEFTNASFDRGVVGMARSQNPNSANSQFFIMLDAAPHLNGQYTVVGEVISGMEYVDLIEKGPAAANGMVDNPDKIITLKVVDDGETR